MEPFNVGQSRGSNTVEFSTRYFTSRQDDPHGVEIPFNRTEDPIHILGSMKNNTYFHGNDNKVLYYMLEYDNEGQPLW